MVEVGPATFTMGNHEVPRWPADGEGPAREVQLSPFSISPTAVSNTEFARFVDATGHVTDAERFGWSFVFALALPDDAPATRSVVGAPWWRQVEGASWQHPSGPGSSVREVGDHPVVHVSHRDARLYCAWAGLRLPTEAEWECAARGGCSGARYPWGNELEPDGVAMCNIFRGEFPHRPSAGPDWEPTVAVDSFAPNGFGLHNMAGNVWEWCADWFDPRVADLGALSDPTGPGTGSHRVIRGGSYLCHDSYCDRYRVAARSSNAPDSSTANMGFRVASG